METINSYEGWVGTDAYDVNGDKIGAIDAIYYDDQTGRPEWMAIRTGFFGMNTSFVPIAGATTVMARCACRTPRIRSRTPPTSRPTAISAPMRSATCSTITASPGTPVATASVSASTASTTSTQPTRSEAEVAETTRSEEQLRVGTEKVATGKARLRKYVVTEQQNVTVPVTREEVRVERDRSPTARPTTSVTTRPR